MEFEVLGAPQGKRRPRFTTVNGYARTYDHEDDLYYANAVVVAFKEARPDGYDLYEKPLKMRITALHSVPKSFSKKKTAQALQGEIFPMKKPDADNVAKLVCDALNGIAYRDDTQVIELVVVKRYAPEPKVIVEIEVYK